MKVYLVEAIILKSVKTREADRLLTLYTRQAGKMRVMAHGVEKPASRKRGAVQPFGYSKLLLHRGKDLDSVSQGEGIEIFPALRQSLEGLAGANYMAELVDAFTVDDDPNPHVFELLIDTFRMLGGEHDFAAARAFEIKLVSFLGYRPGLESCVLCESPAEGEKSYFLPAQGGLVCTKCGGAPGHALEVSRGALESLKALLRWETGRIHQLKLSRAAGKEIKTIMEHFIEYHLEKKIKSARFQKMFGRE
jgi:DNA repair protein RecO (recombination protein O)